MPIAYVEVTSSIPFESYLREKKTNDKKDNMHLDLKTKMANIG